MSVQLSKMPAVTEAPSINHASRVNRIPLATYRLQLSESFGFEQIRELIPYLKQLGVSDLYLSPLFRARAGSTHGYDVVDHGAVEPAFGGEPALVRMAEEARAAGMGVVLDVVPNHMGINDSGNRYWLDVLENGETARWANFFDIDWDAIPQTLKHRVLQPVLGRPFGAALEQGELRVVYAERRLQVEYFDRRFPLAPRTWPVVLQLVVERLAANSQAGDENKSLQEERRLSRIERTELESIIAQLRHLPASGDSSATALRERYREQRIARRRLAHLVGKRPRVEAALAAAIDEINGVVGEPSSFDRLEELLRAQCYRLAYWRVASDEINYRRFFDINELAAIRVEDSQVFEMVHRLVGSLLERGLVTGLRIDHPDGLLDPAQYFQNLQALYRRSLPEDKRELAGPLYVVAEKILSGDEQLPTDWAVSGTTGYEFINLVSRLLVDGDGVKEIRAAYEELSGVEETAAEIHYESKKEAASVAMLSEMQMLAARLYRIAQRQRASRDFTLPTLLRSLQEVVACLAVYRTYVPPRGWEAGEEDHRRIGLAVRLAKRRNPSMSRSLFDFIASVLLLQFPTALNQEDREAWRHFALKLQQVSGPITAKGIEDTAFYRYYPLASLNEVGGELDAGGLEVEEFHRLMHHRAATWPNGMSASSTHDTKRSEDVRARLHVLSETPRRWKESVLLWRQMNRRFLADWDGDPIPDANEEYFIYQTLVGTWPVTPLDEAERETYADRIVQYMEKALREAKLHTSWMNPSEEYETRAFDFVRKILGPEAAAFQTDLGQFVTEIADAGFVNSLTQVLLKATLPGAPDFYQGTELWDFSLVDPDNRRPIDYAIRQKALQQLDGSAERDLPGIARELGEAWPDPRIKLLVTLRSLAARRQFESLFAIGEYLPLEVSGDHADHLFAFARRAGDDWAVVVTPRRFYRLTRAGNGKTAANGWRAEWGDAKVVLPADAGRHWRCELSGQKLEARPNDATLTLAAHELFTALPVALLTNTAGMKPAARI
ncbi:MAG: malto-oligosyltrehalose synthase [Pirellula sp.]|nr:malto-oligosyltrehalose synthase [Pirellula sp.]